MTKKVLPFLLLLLLLGGVGVLWGPSLFRQFQSEATPHYPDIPTEKKARNTFFETALPPPSPYELSWPKQPEDTLKIKLINASFLHNTTRNYYGNAAPNRLDILWKYNLGHGTTWISTKRGTVDWAGAGWTGQPLLIEENDSLFLIQGAYDHSLRKFNAHTGAVQWRYMFDDVIKGTGTLWINRKARTLEEACLILQGSRLGEQRLTTRIVDSYRAISYFTGKEFWRINSSKTRSYSRDVDASALLLNDTAYIGLENGLFTVFNPDPTRANWQARDSFYHAEIIQNSDTLYTAKDIKRHGGNLVTEASPVRLGNYIYIASGSGHVYGFNLKTKKVDWDFYIGSDIDGSPVVTADSCLLISIEKQYIRGRGGLLKINPRKTPDKAIVWFFPVENATFSSWLGGIIGTSATNSQYQPKHTPLIACTAIDGHLYVVRDTLSGDSTLGYDAKTRLPMPQKVFQYKIGVSISTPLFTDKHLVAAGYDGLYLFGYERDSFKLIDNLAQPFEASPVVHNERLYIASRNGFLYCLGDTSRIQ